MLLLPGREASLVTMVFRGNSDLLFLPGRAESLVAHTFPDE